MLCLVFLFGNIISSGQGWCHQSIGFDRVDITNGAECIKAVNVFLVIGVEFKDRKSVV